MKLLLIAAIFLGYVVASDVLGVVISFIADVLPLRAISTPLFYTIWFVIGSFCGLLSFQSMGAALCGKSDVDWSQNSGARRTGLLVLAVALPILTALCYLCYRLLWIKGGSSEFFVPDHPALSITFFGSIFVSLVGAQFLLGPSKDRSSG